MQVTTGTLQVLKAYYGTPKRFDHFLSNTAGIHLGTFDLAAHAATLKLARMDPLEFAKLQPDENGWMGCILEVEASFSRIKRVPDARTSRRWANVIYKAKAEGYDALVYHNAFEGRKEEESYVFFDPSQLRVLGQA